MRRILVAGLAIAVLLVSGCKKEEGQTSGTEIVVGEYGSMSGTEATFGQSTHNGIMLAMDEVNAAGGVLGKQIRVVSEDDQGNQDEAVTVVKRLINRDNVCAVLGEVASTNSEAGGGICEASKIPMISPSSTNPYVTRDKKTGHVFQYLFRVCFTDDFQGSVGAAFGAKKGWKRVAILTCSDQDYSKNLALFFKDAFAKSGQIVADETYSKEDKDFTAQLTRIQSTNPDAVYIPGYYNNVVLILRQARENVGLNVPFFGGDGWDSAETLKLGKIADGCYYTNHYSPDDPHPSVQAFIKAYQAKYNGETPDAMAITGYDAAKVLVDAIRRAGNADPQAIRDAIEATKGFPGAGGEITIDANHNARKPIVILEIRDGKTHLADSIQPG